MGVAVDGSIKVNIENQKFQYVILEFLIQDLPPNGGKIMESRELMQEIEELENSAGGSIDPTDLVILHRLAQLEFGQREIKDAIVKIDKRVQHLEFESKYTRWAFAGAGAVAFIFVREFGPALLRLLTNSASEAFIQTVMMGLG